MKQFSMKQFTETTHNLSGAIMLTGQTLISAFFVIVILVLVLIVEIQRVAHGILLFEQSENLAYLGAFVLVMMLLTLEFVVHYVEAKNDYHEQLQTQFSLRLTWQWIVYASGFSDQWQPRHKSPAQSIKSYSRLLTLTILALAVAGSMSSAINNIDGNWIDGLQAIAMQSTLAEIIEWTGGLLFALALVIGTQRLTAYVAQRASETLIEASDSITPDTKVQVTETQLEQLSEPIIHIVEPELPLLDAEHPEFTVDCVCGWTKTYDNPDSSQRGLNAHQQKCSIYQEYANNEQLLEVQA